MADAEVTSKVESESESEVKVSSGFRTVRNRCSKVRVEVGEKTLRCVSFFADHPSMCPEDQWHPKHIGADFVLIDTFTLQLMSECESQFLVEPDSANDTEPAIVAVEMRPRRDGGRPKSYGKTTEKDDIAEGMEKLTVDSSEETVSDPKQVKDTI